MMILTRVSHIVNLMQITSKSLPTKAARTRILGKLKRETSVTGPFFGGYRRAAGPTQKPPRLLRQLFAALGRVSLGPSRSQGVEIITLFVQRTYDGSLICTHACDAAPRPFVRETRPRRTSKPAPLSLRYYTRVSNHTCRCVT